MRNAQRVFYFLLFGIMACRAFSMEVIDQGKSKASTHRHEDRARESDQYASEEASSESDLDTVAAQQGEALWDGEYDREATSKMTCEAATRIAENAQKAAEYWQEKSTEYSDLAWENWENSPEREQLLITAEACKNAALAAEACQRYAQTIYYNYHDSERLEDAKKAADTADACWDKAMETSTSFHWNQAAQEAKTTCLAYHQLLKHRKESRAEISRADQPRWRKEIHATQLLFFHWRTRSANAREAAEAATSSEAFKKMSFVNALTLSVNHAATAISKFTYDVAINTLQVQTSKTERGQQPSVIAPVKKNDARFDTDTAEKVAAQCKKATQILKRAAAQFSLITRFYNMADKADAAGKPNAQKYREIGNASNNSIHFYTKAAETSFDEYTFTSATWENVGKAFHDRRIMLTEAMEADKKERPAIAQKYREAARRHQESVKPFSEAAEAFAENNKKDGTGKNQAGLTLCYQANELAQSAKWLDHAYNIFADTDYLSGLFQKDSVVKSETPLSE